MSDAGRIDRRRFFKRLAQVAGGALAGVTAAQLIFEDRWLQVTRPRISIPDLPSAFDGLCIGHLTDIHHGPYLSYARVNEIVDLASQLAPDLWVITGDLVYRSPKYIEPVWQSLGRLKAPLGVWCVMGNHDHWEGIALSRRAARAAGIACLDNDHTILRCAGERLWLAGVGDRWCHDQRLPKALRGLPREAVALLLAHNPEVADDMTDPRVKLMLAGHTHGGQVALPLFGPLLVPGQRRYASGLVRTQVSQVYVSRGIGMGVVPFRLNCRPELPVYQLHRA